MIKEKERKDDGINGGTIQKGITNKGAGTITITDGMINGGI